jgi:hypothetical protein
MVALPFILDPTLEAADRALEDRALRDKPRRYLGMSAIGHSCERNLWYIFRWVTRTRFSAEALKRFADGHAAEDVQAQRLRLVEGVTLWTVDPKTGRQFGYTDHGGHFGGHKDGVIAGILQAPKTVHVWEHKAVNDTKLAKLEKLKAELGEKQALAAWDTVYYAQAVLYMHYSQLNRHYLTASSPGGRRTVSCRTEANPELALRLIAKAERIIFGKRPPARLSNDPSWFECRWCSHREICHEGQWSDRNCRTCLWSTPADGGGWHCGLYDYALNADEQLAGCDDHRFIPELVPGEQVDAAEVDALWIEYRLRDGSTFIDGAKA